MLELRRRVPFCITGDANEGAQHKNNTYAAWPPMRGLGRYYDLEVCCAGEADVVSGYFINIKDIDAAVREQVIPVMRELVSGPAAMAREVPMGVLMQHFLFILQEPLHHKVTDVILHLTPTLSLSHQAGVSDMVFWTQRYQFSAAHRLHCDTWDETQNQQVFGKCNRLHGHGHNYQLEVTVASEITGEVEHFQAAELDQWVNDAVIEPLDHTFLNKDVDAFKEKNPTVEHIAAQIWQWLVLQSPEGISLHEISVWETDKTRCIYRG